MIFDNHDNGSFELPAGHRLMDGRTDWHKNIGYSQVKCPFYKSVLKYFPKIFNHVPSYVSQTYYENIYSCNAHPALSLTDVIVCV